MLKYFTGKSLDVLVERIKSLLRTVMEEKPNNHLVAVFLLDSLPENISELVRIQFGSQMNLSSILSASKNLLSSAVVNDHLASEFCHANVREKSERSGERKQIKEDDVKCFCCNQYGHIRRECHIICFKCGNRGHFQRDCFKQTASGNEVAGVEKSDPTASARRH